MALLRDRALVCRPGPQQRFKNISNSWISTCSICIDQLKRCILNSTFSPKLDMQSYPVTLKKRLMSPKHYISILMMYLCKFGKNISTRCSDKLQISFFLPWVGYFGIFFGMKSLLIYAYKCSKYLEYI